MKKTVLRLHDAYSDAGFLKVAGTAWRPNGLDPRSPPTFKHNAFRSRALTQNGKWGRRGNMYWRDMGVTQARGKKRGTAARPAPAVACAEPRAARDRPVRLGALERRGWRPRAAAPAGGDNQLAFFSSGFLSSESFFSIFAFRIRSSV
jgi:hypothetical protein